MKTVKVSATVLAIAFGAFIGSSPLVSGSAWADGDDRRDRREERGRSDERQDRRECRHEEGLVGDDKRECKQEEVRDGVRGNRKDDKKKDEE